jgi:hypothetical protein
VCFIRKLDQRLQGLKQAMKSKYCALFVLFKREAGCLVEVDNVVRKFVL